MPRPSLKLLPFLIACLCLLPGSGSAQSPQREPIRIGAVLPLKSEAGQQSLNAIRLAIDEINATGGALGRRFELVAADDGMSPETGAAAIEKLAQIDKVDLFVGGVSSSVHLAQIPGMKKHRKITLWSGSASAKVEQALKGEDWFFHLHPWDYQQARSFVDGWQAITQRYPSVKTKKWFIAYENGAFGSSSSQTQTDLFPPDWQHRSSKFRTAASKKGADTYRAIIAQARAENPDVFVWIGYPDDALPILQQAGAADFSPALFIGYTPGWPAEFENAPLGNNIIAYGIWTPAMNRTNPTSRRFSLAYYAAFRETPQHYMAPLNYSAIHIAANAIRSAGTLEKQALIAALKKTDYPSPLGERIAFTPSRHIAHQGLRQQKILQWQNGALQVIWPFEHATALLRYPHRIEASK